MKKLFVVLMCALLTVALFACGKTDAGDAKETTSATTLEVTTTTAATDDVTDPPATTTEATTTTTATTTAATTVAPDPTLSLSQERVIMSTTDTVTLAALVENSTETPTWKSSASDVLTVENGVIKPLKAGEATVTVTVGKLSKECKVTVIQPTAVAPMVSSAENTWDTGIYRDNNGIYFHAFAANLDDFENKEQLVLWVSQNGTEPARASTFGFSYTLAEGSGNLIYYNTDATRKTYDSVITMLDYPELEFTVSYEDAGIILGAYFPYSYFAHVSGDSIVIKPEDTLYFAVQGYDGSKSYNTTYQDITVDFMVPNTYLQWNPDNTIAKHEIEVEQLDPAAIAPPDFATVEYVELGDVLSAETHSWKVSLAHVSNGLVVKLKTSSTDFTTAKEQIVFYLTTNNTFTNRAIVRSFSYYPTTGSYDLINYSDSATKTTIGKDAAMKNYSEVLCNVTTDTAGTEVIWFIPYVYFDHLAESFPITGTYGSDMLYYVAMQGYDGKNSYNITYNGQEAVFTDASTYIKWNVNNMLG